MTTKSVFLLFCYLIQGVTSRSVLTVKILRLEVPTEVFQGDDADLFCEHNMPFSKIHSLKWYHGSKEFFSSEKHFDTTRITNVDNKFHLQVLNETGSHLKLHNVSLLATGMFSCEVTTENFPQFNTDQRSRFLQVLSLPSESPVLKDVQERYGVGETPQITCMSPWSTPAMTLSFLVNGKQLSEAFTVRNQTVSDGSGRYRSLKTVKFQLRRQHFSRGKLKFTCQGTIPRHYSLGHHLELVEVDSGNTMDAIDPSVFSGHASMLGSTIWQWSELLFVYLSLDSGLHWLLGHAKSSLVSELMAVLHSVPSIWSLLSDNGRKKALGHSKRGSQIEAQHLDENIRSEDRPLNCIGYSSQLAPHQRWSPLPSCWQFAT